MQDLEHGKQLRKKVIQKRSNINNFELTSVESNKTSVPPAGLTLMTFLAVLPDKYYVRCVLFNKNIHVSLMNEITICIPMSSSGAAPK